MSKSNSTRKPRSPIKGFIRPRAGATLREQLWREYDETNLRLIAALLFTAIAVLFVIVDWFLPQSIYLLCFGLLAGGWGTYVYGSLRRRTKIHNLELALDGECAVAQALDELREHGYQIVHSIRCDGFDIDHAIIGPSGVYAVETKTFSKRGGAEEQVQWDGQSLSVAGRTPDRDPIAQSKAVARELFNIVKDHAGDSIFVQPVVVFPGWYVVNNADKSDVWVENEKQLIGRIKSAQTRLDSKRIIVVANALRRYQYDEERRRLKIH